MQLPLFGAVVDALHDPARTAAALVATAPAPLPLPPLAHPSTEPAAAAPSAVVSPSLASNQDDACVAPIAVGAHLEALVTAARTRTIELWELARSRWRIDRRYTLTVCFDLRGRTVGKAIRNGDALGIRYNPAALAQNPRDMLDETIPHEVAHLVCFARPRLGRGHDAGWQAVCVALGGKGGRCYGQGTYELAKARRTWRYAYKLDSGEALSLSHRHHRHLRQGGELHLRRTRERILARHWTGDRELT